MIIQTVILSIKKERKKENITKEESLFWKMINQSILRRSKMLKLADGHSLKSNNLLMVSL